MGDRVGQITTQHNATELWRQTSRAQLLWPLASFAVWRMSKPSAKGTRATSHCPTWFQQSCQYTVPFHASTFLISTLLYHACLRRRQLTQATHQFLPSGQIPGSTAGRVDTGLADCPSTQWSKACLRCKPKVMKIMASSTLALKPLTSPVSAVR